MKVLFSGSVVPEGAFVPGPVTFLIHPDIDITLPVHAGDTVNIDFYADGRRLTSAKATWHDASVPPVLSGQSQPAYRVPAQFLVPNYRWTNVPVGSHVLSIRAYGFRGLSANPPALHVTVLPPLPRQPVIGKHVANGKLHPALKPEQVNFISALPHVAYEVVGTVAARAPGVERKDADAGYAELKKQAALMGANCVILGPVQRDPGTPFSVGKVMFSPPETRLSGEALYVPSYLAQ